jgi:RNA polymerase sigma factor (sigma-70 family)
VTARAEDLLRGLAPQVLGALLRRYGNLDLCEDAVQDALIEAYAAWTERGIPEHPRGWLHTAANRRMIDLIRGETARRQREERLLAGAPPAEMLNGPPGEDTAANRDDSLTLLLLCCHPALTTPSQIALTLRAVGGLTTREIAAAFFVPEVTMAQRISRAKQRIREAGATFTMPEADDLSERLHAVEHILYLIFNEGYTSSSGPDHQRPELTTEAIRLTRGLHGLRPNDSEVAGLLALMLLTEARRAARLTPSGELVALADQDRGRWDRSLIDEGLGLVTEALASGPIGAYQLQAAIAAVHDQASSADETDWAEILALYELLDRLAPNPMATLNRAVAVGMVHGPAAGLALLDTLAGDDRVAGHHLLYAVRGYLLDMTGRAETAAEAFRDAARRTASIPEKRYLQRRAAEALQRSRSPSDRERPGVW